MNLSYHKIEVTILNFFHLLAQFNEEVKNASFQNASGNAQLVSSDIQNDICDVLLLKLAVIIKDMGDTFFAILVDESRDASVKEQMAVCLRYVGKEGKIIECFLGIEHVPNTIAASLKASIEQLLSRHGLSISQLRGQGYDGASNMQGELKGLKTLILNENPCAFYVHCFAHQLQLGLVAVVKSHLLVQYLFEVTSKVINVVGGSCKRQDILKDAHRKKLEEALIRGELFSGRGLNQETNLQRPGDTRWSSHYASLIRFTSMFSSIVEVLEFIEDDGVSDQRVEAHMLSEAIQSFKFAFAMHLMKRVLGITNELSIALQKKEQEIENVMRFVQISKQRLQDLRDDGWDSLFNEVASFCSIHEIVIPDMNEKFGHSKRRNRGKTNETYFCIELFCAILDKQLMELNSRFSATISELLRFVGCLNPRDSFFAFNKESLVNFARLYPREFSTRDLELLDNQLEPYIIDMRSSIEFSEIDGIGDLAKKMVETKRHNFFLWCTRFFALALTLPVATATVERAFSPMKIIKNRLRTRMSDDRLNACLVTYIEKEVLDEISNEVVMQRFQTMRSRREQL